MSEMLGEQKALETLLKQTIKTQDVLRKRSAYIPSDDVEAYELSARIHKLFAMELDLQNMIEEL